MWNTKGSFHLNLKGSLNASESLKSSRRPDFIIIAKTRPTTIFERPDLSSHKIMHSLKLQNAIDKKSKSRWLMFISFFWYGHTTSCRDLRIHMAVSDSSERKMEHALTQATISMN